MPTPQPNVELSGREKAAVLLLSLGVEQSAQVLRHFSDAEIEEITLAVANPPPVDAQTRRAVLQEFHELLEAHHYVAQGGLQYAQELLERALGSSRALEILHRLSVSLQARPFEAARRSDPTQLLTFLQGEHPQTIALVLSYVTPEQAASVLRALPPELQADVTQRIASMDRTPPDVVKEVERVLETRLGSMAAAEFSHPGGVDVVVSVLNRVDRGTEKSIMQRLEAENPDLAQEIKRRMFLFEDIARLDDRFVQRILRDIDTHDLTLALKGASDTIREKLLSNVSSRVADMVREELQYMGPVRLREVEEAQGRIVAVVRQLEEEGEIVLSHGGEDDVLV
jgi:flagellar motor switch protein FliG